MSWRTCYSGSNNIHFDFPPIMNDGRNYATWQPGAAINEAIRKEQGIKTNWQYRKYLMENADTIIKNNQLSVCNQYGSCPALYNKEQSTTNTPFLYKSALDTTQPYGYENSDLKQEYLTKHQLQSRMVTPVLTQAQLLQSGIPNSN